MGIPVGLKFNRLNIYLCRDLKNKDDSEEGQEESEVPRQLLSVPDLPPSLLPPPPGGWKVKVNTEWGWNIHFVGQIIVKWKCDIMEEWYRLQMLIIRDGAMFVFEGLSVWNEVFQLLKSRLLPFII